MSMLCKHTAYYGPPQLIDGKLESGTRSIFLIVSNAIILSRRFTLGCDHTLEVNFLSLLQIKKKWFFKKY